MATKLYLHQAASTAKGTLPASNVSVSATTPAQIGDSGTNRSMTRTIGASQQSVAITTAANVNPQASLIVRFISDRLAAQTFNVTSVGDVTFGIGGSESNAQSNFFVTVSLATWRPSTGALVTRIQDLVTITAEPGTSETSLTFSSGATGLSATVADGDVLICEIWRDPSVQGNATARTNTVFYDGTTEASTTSNAAFINFPNDTLIFAPQSWGQANASIKTTNRGYGQAQADIKATSNGYAQARAIVKLTSNAQAQADIKATSNAYGQARALIPNWFFGQTQALISRNYTSVTDTFTRSVSDDWGSADVGGAWTRLLGTASEIDVNGSVGTIVTTDTKLLALYETLHPASVEFSYDFSLSALPSSGNFIIAVTGYNGSSAGSTGIVILRNVIVSTGDMIPTVNSLSVGSPVYTVGQTWRYKAQIVKSSGAWVHRGKLWNLATTEPGWQLDSTATINAEDYGGGYLTLTVGNATGAPTVTFDNFNVKQAFITQYGQAQAQIKQTYPLSPYGKTILKDAPVSYWRFNESSGLPRDSLATNDASAVAGTLTYRVAGALSGDPDTAISFNGSTNAVRVPHSASLTMTGSDMSIEVWIKIAGGTGTNRKIIVKGAGAGWGLQLRSDDILYGSAMGVGDWALSNTTLTDTTQFHHIVAVRASTGGKMYLDGVDVTTSSGTPVITDDGSDVGIGGYPDASSETFNGVIDEPAVYNYALTATQVARHYAVRALTAVGPFGQAQADIKATSNGYGQARALIPNWFFGQAQALIAGAYTTVIDTFTRSVSNGLGSADTGGAYTRQQGTASEVNVTGSVATIVTTNQKDYYLLEVLHTPSVEFSIDFSLSALPSSGSMNFNLSGYRGTPDVGSNTGLQVIRVTIDSAGAITSTVNGTPVTTGTYSVGQTWRMKGQLLSSSGSWLLRGKSWDLATTEPGWATGSSVVVPTDFGGGHVALETGSATGAPTWTFDNFNVKQAFITYSGQAQAKIQGVASAQGYGQAQADILATSNAFAQAQADILAKSNGYAQAQADIKTTSNAFAQAQGDIKVTSNAFAQAQADIKQTYNGYGQAQSDIKATSNGYAQANADIKATSNAFAQAQAKIIPTRVYGQAQADIKATSNSFAQAQADILKTTNAFAQTQADIKQTYNAFAQAQADIKQTYNAFGQAQADIKATSNAFAQAQAKIIPTRVFGQAQADIKQTYNGFGQAQADILHTYQGYGQCQASIINTYQGYGQSQADIKATSNGYGQCQADIKATSNGYGQSQADIKQINNGYGQAQGDIKATYQAYAQAQADIKQTYQDYAQAQADIKQTYQGYGQSQADIKTTYNAYAQAQADIKATYQAYAQAQGYIKTEGVNAYGQSQADIKTTYQAYGQANADIKATTNQFAQAQADINTNYQGYGQAQACIRANVFGQAQADIKATSNAYAQAQAKINAFGVKAYGQANAQISSGIFGFGQAQAKIKTTRVYGQAQGFINKSKGLGQAQADIKATSQAYGQSQADIKAIGRGFGQACADIEATINQFAQAQADILATTNKFAQAQADIKQTGQGYGQSQSDIKAVGYGFGQACADIKAISRGYGQCQADIKQTANAFGQAQSDIKATSNAYGQVQAKIIPTRVYGQANADILATNQNYGQAQAQISTGANVFAQAQADIKVITKGYGQSQATITSGVVVFGQAQAYIFVVTNQSGQSQATIIKPAGFGQAQAEISREHTLGNVIVSDERSTNVTLSDIAETITLDDSEDEEVELSEESITVTVSDEQTLNITLEDLAFI